MKSSSNEIGHESARKSSGIRHMQSELRLAIEVEDRIVCHSYQIPPQPKWTDFEAFLKNKLDFLPNFCVRYQDEDRDEVCLESQEEFLEALKVYNKVGSVLMLHVIPIENDAPNSDFSLVDAEGFPAQVSAELEAKISNLIPYPCDSRGKTVKNGQTELNLNISPDDTVEGSLPNSNIGPLNIIRSTEEKSGDNRGVLKGKSPQNRQQMSNDTGCRPKEQPCSPPEWFTSYMEKFKGDIAAEVTKKVVHRMQKMMINGGILTTNKQQTPTAPRVENTVEADSTLTEFSSKSHHDLSQLPSHAIHTGIFCDHCGDQVVGIRYKCGNCAKFDLCENCESLKDIHDRYHVFVKMRRPCSTAGLKKKTGTMAPLFKYALYDAENDRIPEIRSEREKKLLKRLEKQARKLEHYREKYRVRHLERETRHVPWDAGATNTTTAHRGVHTHHHHHGHQHGHHRGHHAHHSQIRARAGEDEQQSAFDLTKPANDNTTVVVSSVPPTVTTQNNYNPFTIDMMDAKFLHDETIPDGTILAPGMKFTKRWRMLNSGTKPWNAETVLKCLWGTLELVMHENAVPTPHLAPGETGTISVEFTAPASAGQYDSHWRLYHQGMRFGHRIWCNIIVSSDKQTKLPAPQKRTLSFGSDQSGSLRSSSASSSTRDVSVDSLEGSPRVNIVNREVQIQEPENGEKEQVMQGHMNALHMSMSGAWQDAAASRNLKPPYTSVTATPNNTPLDLSPPKSPEPLDADGEEGICTDSGVAGEKDDEDRDMSFLSEDSDFGGSLVSLSSTDSDMGYVVVPLPPCFTFTLPSVSLTAVAADKDASTSEPLSSPGKDENSSVTTATDTDEESSEAAACKDHSSDSIEKDARTGNATDSEDEHSHHTLKGDDEVTKVTCKKVENRRQSTIEAESGENLSPASDYDVAKGVSRSEPPSDSAIPIDGSVSNSHEKFTPEETMPRGSMSHTSPSEESPATEQPVPPSEPNQPVAPRSLLSPMEQLVEMGFFNREQNRRLLTKHNNDLDQVVGELVTLMDNDWYSNRH